MIARFDPKNLQKPPAPRKIRRPIARSMRNRRAEKTFEEVAKRVSDHPSAAIGGRSRRPFPKIRSRPRIRDQAQAAPKSDKVSPIFGGEQAARPSYIVSSSSDIKSVDRRASWIRSKPKSASNSVGFHRISTPDRALDRAPTPDRRSFTARANHRRRACPSSRIPKLSTDDGRENSSARLRSRPAIPKASAPKSRGRRSANSGFHSLRAPILICIGAAAPFKKLRAPVEEIFASTKSARRLNLRKRPAKPVVRLLPAPEAPASSRFFFPVSNLAGASRPQLS